MADFTGSILELKGNRATVITDKCDFLVIKRSSGMFVGQQVGFNKSDICTLKKSYTKYLAIAASICIIICSYFLYYQFYMPSKVFAYIDVDINPSVEFSVDENKHVISVKPLNEDAKPLVEGGSFKKLLITEAIEKLIMECEKDGFIKPENETEILISGSPDTDTDKNENQLDGILSEINSKLEKDNTKVNAECIKVKPQERAQAVENNISMGRYALFSKIKEDDSNITVEQAKNSKVSEIIDKARGKSHTDTESDTDRPNTDSNKTEKIKDGEEYFKEHSNNDKKSDEKKNNGVKQEKQGSSGISESKGDENIQNNQDKRETKKQSDSEVNANSRDNSEVKGDSKRDDSRNISGAAVTPVPKTNDSKENADSDNGKKNSVDSAEDSIKKAPKDTQKNDAKDKDKHTDNNEKEEHTGKDKK